MNNNYQYLFNLNYSNNIILYFIFYILIIVVLASCVVSTYDTYTAYGKYFDKKLHVNIPIENSDIVNSGNELAIGKEKKYYQIKEISNILETNLINYQEYMLKITNCDLFENEVVKVTFYYNKEKLIKKIINLIF